jgi:diaminopropionate ammonia-lyase
MVKAFLNRPRFLTGDLATRAEATAARLSRSETVSETRKLFALHPGFAPTPLVSMPTLAGELGVDTVWVKDERDRWGLASFKALGGTYAVLTLVAELLSKRSGEHFSAAQILSGEAPSAADITVATATAGNHGRAVAFGAQLAGAYAVIFVYGAVPDRQIKAIARHGATIVQVAGDAYEPAFEAAVAQARQNGWHLVSDVPHPGYEEIPARIMEGYAVSAAEALEQLTESPTHIFIQAGVGGLAAPYIAYFSAHCRPRPRCIVVEGEHVRCLLESAREGRPIQFDTGARSIMGRLDAGIPGSLTWPLLAQMADAFAAVSDETASEAEEALSAHGMPTSPTGAAGLAGAMHLLRDENARQYLELNGKSKILVIATELNPKLQ